MFLVMALPCASCDLTRRRGDAEVFFPVFFSLRIPRVSACPLSPHAEARRRGGAEVFAAHASSFPASRHASGEFTRRREAAEVDGL